MFVQLNDLRFCLDKATELTGPYELYVRANSCARSLDDFLDVCRQYVRQNIRVLQMEEPVPNKTIHGFYVNEPEGYSIVLTPDMDSPLGRYVLCKELFHIILDSPEYRTTDIFPHLQEVWTTFPVEDSQPGPGAVSEVLAEIAAMEFLFPYRERVRILARPDCNFAEIASQYKLPQYLVERHLSESFMTNLGALMGPPA